MTTVSQLSSAMGLSKFATQTLRQMSEGKDARKSKSGSYQLGAKTLPSSLIAELEKKDLVQRQGDQVIINSRGHSLLKRMCALKPSSKAQHVKTDPYVAQHQQRGRKVVKAHEGMRSVVVNLSDSPLWWLKSRKGKNGRPLISQTQFDAGERLRSDWETAHKGPRVTMNWDMTIRDSGQCFADKVYDPTPTEMNAKLRFERALEVLGPGLSDIVLRVCCHHEGLEGAERALNWPQRSGKVVLSIALSQLARHYGLD
ncbi:MAG: DUF6456 domain-containing protein [Sphingomonadales bacterium]